MSRQTHTAASLGRGRSFGAGFALRGFEWCLGRFINPLYFIMRCRVKDYSIWLTVIPPRASPTDDVDRQAGRDQDATDDGDGRSRNHHAEYQQQQAEEENRQG